MGSVEASPAILRNDQAKSSLLKQANACIQKYYGCANLILIYSRLVQGNDVDACWGNLNLR
jgi:hypothetical protein